MLGSRCCLAAVDELQSLNGFRPTVCVGDYPYVNNGAKPSRQRKNIMCVCLYGRETERVHVHVYCSCVSACECAR